LFKIVQNSTVLKTFTIHRLTFLNYQQSLVQSSRGYKITIPDDSHLPLLGFGYIQSLFGEAW
jgi:hypothetical protein